MRVVLLILLIALAPLRGMANELMATRMATTLAMSVSAPAAAGDTHAGGHHCVEMAQAPHHTEQPAAKTASDDGCENCSLCQMCASAALPAELRVAMPVFGPQMQVPTRTDHFASAPAALAEKPPIS
ncbi:hypothetical protein [Rhodoferax mekongensis]|uniref:hypothetical protein n=1 Tax=Rhodoferax mekongensis TaxID=3068341 RepID=UPI0028BE187F|nr:hypothetical protein [Rhodoferax sp. TBRC 17199]MDT7513844.1 hypothetical protein [Rhodoferax sp. TBRC 17199]